MAFNSEYVKNVGEEHQYTLEEIKELKKSKDDLFHFLNHVKIIHPDRGRVTFKPWDYQKELFSIIENNRFVIALIARQQGKSVMVACYLLWYSIFNSDKTVGVVSNNEEGAIDILDRIKIMYEELPDYLKPGVIEYNKKTILFENGTKIKARATSKDSFRGRTLNIVFADEFAFVDPQWKAEEFWTSNWPTISASKESKFIIVSTPKGIGNLFHRIYTEAVKKINTFVPYFADWRAHPERDEKWAEEQMKNLGKRRFNQEFGCQFIGSDATLLDETTLKELDSKEIVDPIKRTKELRIYEKPEHGMQYILGCDVADGSGNHDSVIQILKILNIKPLKLKQVGVYQSNTIDVYKFAYIINTLSINYNDAFIMVESNNMGSSVVSDLWWNFENENLVCDGTKANKLGVRMTPKTKPKACLLMKKTIEDNNIEIVDRETIKQLLTFVQTSEGKYSGNGSPDDLVSGLYLGIYFFTYDILDESMELKTEVDQDDVWAFISDVGDDIEDVEDGYEIIMR